jgi:ABC-type sugar transport system substrate-binding protein
VAFLVPGSPENTFWKASIEFSKAVAEDLGINLQVTNAAENTYSIKRTGQKLLANADMPEYLMTAYLQSVTLEHLELARAKGVKVLLFNTDVSKEEREEIGAPREKFSNWIGQMVPDDVQAGYSLANVLINQAKGKNLVPEGARIELIALTGANNTNVSFDRNFGLERRVSSSNDSRLHEIRFCDWARKSANLETTDLLDKHPGTTVVWAASDSMAFGAIEALNGLGVTAGEGILVGGIDWSSEGVKAVANGQLAATVGGHFMEAGWALIMIYDYHHGIDFKDDVGLKYMTSMSVLESKNVKKYLEKFGEGDWSSVDFKKLSKKYNPSLTKYNFSLDAIMD